MTNFVYLVIFIADFFVKVKSMSKKLDTSLADKDHRGRSSGQRFLLPIAVRGENLKTIVEEQGFHAG